MGELGPQDDLPDPRQMEIYATWTPTQRWEQAVRLRELAWELKTAFIRQEHPGWDETRVLAETRRQFLSASS